MAVQLRPSVLKEIHKTINNTRTHLNVLDFSIRQGDGNLLITYNYNTDYFISFDFTDQEDEYSEREETTSLHIKSTVKEVKKSDHLITGTMAPGNLVLKENFEFHGVYSISRKTEDWMANLWDDLSAHPAVREARPKKRNGGLPEAIFI